MKDNNSTPYHIALIPDGNRRWAKNQSEKPWIGHEKGAERLEELLEYACDQDITFFSVWGSSQANLEKRPLQEKRELIKVYKRYFTKLLTDDVIQKRQIKVEVIGMWREYLPTSMTVLIDRVREASAHHRERQLTVMLAYSGDEEMLRAINALTEEGGHVDAKRLKDKLMTAEMPPVDLMIRTGGEPHMSAGFMMWDLADAEFYFTDVLFPDFDQKHFAQTLKDFAERGRRKGA